MSKGKTVKVADGTGAKVKANPPVVVGSKLDQTVKLLPTGPATPEEVRQMTEHDLIALANGNHGAFVGCLRTAIKDHARVAGSALNELKSRVGHGKWEQWLKEHCEVSSATARVYMRVARDWDEVVKAG